MSPSLADSSRASPREEQHDVPVCVTVSSLHTVALSFLLCVAWAFPFCAWSVYVGLPPTKTMGDEAEGGQRPKAFSLAVWHVVGLFTHSTWRVSPVCSKEIYLALPPTDKKNRRGREWTARRGHDHLDCGDLLRIIATPFCATRQ